MKAIVLKQYGSPDNFHLVEVKKTTPRDNEVLVKVRAAAINEWDWGILHGKPLVNRMTFGLFKPKKTTIIGCDISGQVVDVGKKIKGLKMGDEVFGDISGCGWGGFAQYVCAREDALALKSAHMTFEDAAAIPQAGLLALQGLRKCKVKKGQSILINGAGGGAGTFAIQIARSLGAEVTGVDNKYKLDKMRSLGADHVIDYAKEDFTKNGQQYDLILDVMSRRSPKDYRRSLKPNGRCVLLGGSTGKIIKSLFLGSFGNKKVKLLLLRPNPKDLAHMNELFETGKVKPIIDRCFQLSEVPRAFRYYGEGRFKGKVVITVEHNDKT